MAYSDEIIITGASVAYVGLIDQGKGTTFKVYNLAGDSGAKKLNFDTLEKIAYKFTLPAENTDASNIEVPLAIGTKITFPQITGTISGITEAIESSSSSSSGINGGEITLNINGADMDSASWSVMIKKIVANLSKYWFIAIPTGYTYNSLKTAGTPNVEGFLFMIGKISSEISSEAAGNANSKLTLTFKSASVAAYADSEDTDAMDDTALDTWFASTSNILLPNIVQPGVSPTLNVNPPALGATDGHILAAGGIVTIAA